MLYYHTGEAKRYNTNMMKRNHVDFSNLPAFSYYPLRNVKPEGFDRVYDDATDNGTLYDAGNSLWYIDWSVSDRDLDEAKAEVTAMLAIHRYENESNGITFGGNAISTSRESMAMINTAYTQAAIDAGAVIQFKTQDGWVTYDSIQMIALAKMAVDHIQLCFTAESEIAFEMNNTADIDALRAISITTEFASKI